MTYASKQDVDNLYGKDELLKLAPNSDGTATVNETMITAALEYSHGEIDKKLVKRYTLPLTQQSDYLRGVCIDFTLYHLALWRDVLTDEHISRYERHLKELNAIRDGKEGVPFNGKNVDGTDFDPDGDGDADILDLDANKGAIYIGTWGRG